MHLLLILLASVPGIIHATPLPKPFKCAGDTDKICETGYCYDDLSYAGERKSGCAPADLCSEIGCFMHEDVFTCCCASRYCNGKTDELMWSKFRRFKDNNFVWPTFFPRLHAPPQIVDGTRDIRLSPMKTTTSFDDKPLGIDQSKFNGLNNAALNPPPSPTIPRPPETTTLRTSSTGRSSTTERYGSSTPLLTKPGPLPNVVKVNAEEDPMLVDFDLRTTRSNPHRARPTTSSPLQTSTTKRKRPTAHPTFIPATVAPSIPPKQRETHVQQSYPWYYLTIVGFVIACILFGIAVFIIRRCRAKKAAEARRNSNDSLPNSSFDSSRMSDIPLHANELSKEPADPLLRRSFN